MPLTRPVPSYSMKLKGVFGEVEPGGMPSTLPQRTTWIAVPWKCSFWASSMVFHWPPWPAVGLQPGLMLPPQLYSLFALPLLAWPRFVLVIELNLAPPPVSQQRPAVHVLLEITKLRVNSNSD